MKDLASSIDSAQAVFATRRDASSIAEQLNTIGTIAVDIAGAVIKGKTSSEKESGIILTLRFRVFAMKDYAGSLKGSVDNISRLLAKLEPDAEQSKRASTLQVRAADIEKRCDDEAGHLEPWAVDPKHRRTQKDLDKLTFEVVPLMSDSWSLSEDIQKLAEDVLKRAEQTKERQEHRYRWINWLSIGLFTAGWGLGLIAKLYGVDGVGAES